MTTTPPVKSEYVKIPRSWAERLLKQAKQIQSMEKTPGLLHPGDGYANALGRCNGIATDMVISLETLGVEVR